MIDFRIVNGAAVVTLHKPTQRKLRDVVTLLEQTRGLLHPESEDVARVLTEILEGNVCCGDPANCNKPDSPCAKKDGGSLVMRCGQPVVTQG